MEVEVFDFAILYRREVSDIVSERVILQSRNRKQGGTKTELL